MTELSLERFHLLGGRLSDDVAADLFVQWCTLLAEAQLGIHGSGSGAAGPRRTYNFGQGTEKTFTLARDVTSGNWTLDKYAGIEESAIASIVNAAAARTAAQDFGLDVVYQVELLSKSFDLSRRSRLHMMRLLGDQVRISGWRRLSDRVLLEFLEEPPKTEPILFAPDCRIKVTVFVPGPVAGPLAQRVASAMIETAAAICAFGLGRSVELPMIIGFPLRDAQAASMSVLRWDPSIRGLARDGVSLDVFGDLAILGGVDALLRGRAAFITLHEALAQTNADVATILYVAAIEALITPSQPWGRERMTKRFVEAVLSLCEPAVDAALAHQNVEQAFQHRKRGGVQRQRQDLLGRIYALRSRPSHMGVEPSRGGTLIGLLGDDHSMRLAILSDLSRAALLAYLTAPRSFLTGHPAVSPTPEEGPPSLERGRFRSAPRRFLICLARRLAGRAGRQSAPPDTEPGRGG